MALGNRSPVSTSAAFTLSDTNRRFDSNTWLISSHEPGSAHALPMVEKSASFPPIDSSTRSIDGACASLTRSIWNRPSGTSSRFAPPDAEMWLVRPPEHAKKPSCHPNCCATR